MADPRLLTTAVLLLLCWGTQQTNAQVPTVSITVSGTSPPGFTPGGPTEYRAASGRYTFTCTATGGPGSGDYDYVWTSTCSACNFQTSSTGATSEIFRQVLHSGDSGTHTCTATRGGQSGSDSIIVTIVGAGIYVLAGFGEEAAQPNNGLVISLDTVLVRRFRFYCRSNSLTFDVGELIGLDGSLVAANSFFNFETPGEGGELRIENRVGVEVPLTASEQGVYTCRIPLEGGEEIREINIGVYPSGFSTIPSISTPLVFTQGSSSSTLTCTSTDSVATTVTFTRDSTTVGPLRDGESMEFGGVTYQLTQTVTDRAQSTYQNVLTINQPLADIEGSTFTCSAENQIGTAPASQPLTIMVVSITVSGTSPPGFTPGGPTEYRAASGRYTFTCTATGGPGSGDYDYVWTSTCSACEFQTSSTGTTSEIFRQVLHSGDGGTHTCTATRGGQSGSDSIIVTIVGAGIYVLAGFGEEAAQPNNGLVISLDTVSGRRFRFFCRSNSLTFDVGELIGLDGSLVVANSFFNFDTPGEGGELRIENRADFEVPLTASEQGVYTCRIPLEGGEEIREINIGVYPSGFSTIPSISNPLVFTQGSSSSTLTCTSTESVATTVTFTRDSTTVGPLRDGESMEFDGVTYQLAQILTNRAQSTYQNVLTINQPLADIEGSTFTCSAENQIGTAPASQPFTIMAIEITSSSQTLTVGDTATITCTSLLGQADTIEWLLVDGPEMLQETNSGQAALELVLDPVSESMNGSVYRCRVTIGGATVDQDVTVTIQAPDVTVLITTSGSAVVGMSYTLNCTVSGADNLEATTSIEFIGPNFSGSGTGTFIRLPLLALELTDAGGYTCTATVSSGLLTNDLISNDTVDVTLQIPSLTVSVEHDGGSTIYSGSMLTLTCDISLLGIVPPILSIDATVTATWLGASGNMLSTGGTITVNPAVDIDNGNSYESTVVFNTARTSNEGTYTCQATVTHSSPFITGIMTPGHVMISVVAPNLLLTVLSSTTRLPNMTPYNTFTLTCTATAPMGVIESKTFTWRRTSGSGGSCGSFSEITDSGTLQITNSNVDQPVSTSVLTVTETTAAVWRYCCQATLFEGSGTSDEVAVTVTGPAPPQQPTTLMNVDTDNTSFMIQWTLPIISYTPETYVVNYGTSMSSLDTMSDPVQSGNDFEAVNQAFSVELAGLVDTTTYFYQVVATNGQGSTSSAIQSFNTTILRPGPPQNFLLTMSTTTSLGFSWNPPSPIDGVNAPSQYIVRCEPQLEGIDTPAPVNQNASQETVTVSDLAPGVTYSCSVAAINDQGEGDPAEVSGTTLETAPNGAPQNFIITPGEGGPTSTELTFSWDLPPSTQRNGIITSYTISCSPDAETLPRVETTLPGEGGLTVGGFRSFTEYTCTIFATNSQGSGPPANSTTMTNEDAPDGPPQSPSFTTTGSPEILIFTVQPPLEGLRNGVIISYGVRCIPSDAFNTLFTVTGTISGGSGEVGDFIPAAEYICFFTSSTSEGPGPETTVGLEVTTLPDAPMITSVMDLSTSEILVEWTIAVPETSGPGTITHYTVYVDSNAVVNTVNDMVSSYVISNLTPFQLVAVQVSASTSAGEGASSEAVDGRSSEASPGPVSNIQWEPQSASSVTVSWSPPLMPNGVILKYSVVLERYEGGPIIDSRELESNVLTTVFTNNQELEAETPYNVTVTARNSAGEGEPVEIADFTEESSSPPFPSNVTILRSSDGKEILVSWTPLTLVEARSLIQFYRVTYDPRSGRRKRQSGTTCSQSPCDVPGTESSVLITELDPSTSYILQVAVVNGGGQRGPSAVVIEGDTPTSSGTDAAPIIGGVVAVVGLLVIAGVVIVLLVLRHHNHRSSLSVEKHSETMHMNEVAMSGDPDIRTTECVAYSAVTQPQDTGYEIPSIHWVPYGQNKQSPRVQEEAVYEVIPGEGDLPPGQT